MQSSKLPLLLSLRHSQQLRVQASPLQTTKISSENHNNKRIAIPPLMEPNHEALGCLTSVAAYAFPSAAYYI